MSIKSNSYCQWHQLDFVGLKCTVSVCVNINKEIDVCFFSDVSGKDRVEGLRQNHQAVLRR